MKYSSFIYKDCVTLRLLSVLKAIFLNQRIVSERSRKKNTKSDNSMLSNCHSWWFFLRDRSLSTDNIYLNVTQSLYMKLLYFIQAILKIDL